MAKDSSSTAGPPSSPFNRTAQHDAKRTAILSQAARLFNSKGSRATTLLDIAESLGLTKTSLYYYVKTKEELIYQCYMVALEHHHKTLDDIELQYSAPLDRVAAFFQQHFDNWQAAHEGRGSYYAALLEIASLKGPHRKEVEAQYIDMFKRLRQFLKDGMADGSVRTLDATSATRALLGSIEWTFFWLHSVPQEDIAHIAEQAWDILLNGLYNAPDEYPPSALAFNGSAKDLAGFNREQQNRIKQEAFYKTGTRFFNRKGFTGTSLDEIAEQLNVTKGAFYYHIKSKDDLLLNCYTRSLDIMAEIYALAIDTEASGLEKVEQTCRRIFHVQNSDRGPLIRYNTITALPRDSRRIVLSRTDEANERFGDMILEGITDGSVRPISNLVAQNLIAGSINAAMDIQLWRRVDDIDEAAIDYFDLFFNGLSPRP